MADNIQINKSKSAGPKVATDSVGGVQYQRVKVNYGEDGTAIDVSLNNPMPITDFHLELSKGNVAGHSHILKFGANKNVASGTLEDIWDVGGIYTFPTTVDITHLSQVVDQIAMRGQTIEIEGLDTNWNSVIQTKTLNATDTTTAVAINTPLRRVFRMRVLANVVADQNIALKNVGGGTTYAQIDNGNNQTLMAIYTVPNGKTAHLTSYYSDIILVTGKEPKSTEIQLWTADRLNNYEFQIKHSKGVSPGNSNFQHFFEHPMKIEQRHDIKITALPNGANADIRAGFDIILVDN